MQGPVVDILLLLLLILFFGSQQRLRPQVYFRFWFVGWLLVVASYAIWEFGPSAGVSLTVENMLRYDLLVLAGVCFTMSFLATADRLRYRFARAALVAVPACVAIDLELLHGLPDWAMLIIVLPLVFVGHGFALATIRRDLEGTVRRRRVILLLFVIVGGIGLAMVVRVLLNPQGQVLTMVLTEIMLCAGVLYLYSQKRTTLAGVVGAVGFIAWGLFYNMAEVLASHPVALKDIYMVWNLPKYFVGFSMILRVFEESAEEYRALYEDFRTLYEGHPHAMWIVSPATHRLMAANQAAIETHGYTEEESLQLRLSDLELPIDAEAEAMAATVPPPTDGRRARFRCKDGRVLWVNVYQRTIMFQGKTAQLVMARDVTGLVEYNYQLAQRAQHDELTGLPNRAIFAERLDDATRNNPREGAVGVLAIDVDHFKLVNDTYGHATGDACLKVVAARLTSRIRKIDTVARVGGEEFMAVVSGLHNEADAMMVAQQLVAAFREPLRLSDCDLPVTISIGVALFPDHGTDIEAIRRLADEALYRAKRDGRNCVRLAEPAKPEPGLGKAFGDIKTLR
jgi:diguanylate cyclase (GGDEF)-like protein/PAS domain S-box-containing protein